MKKLAFIIAVNLILLIFVGFLAECGSFYIIRKIWCYPNNRFILDYKFILKKKDKLMQDTDEIFYKFQGSKNKSPIVLLGCSYTEGFSLKREETFSANLSKNTGRTVYSYGFGGGSMATVLTQLQSKDFLKQIPQNTEYFIYTYIIDHNKRCHERSLGWENDVLLDLYRVNDKQGIEKVPCGKVCCFINSTAIGRLYRMTLGQYLAKSGDFSLPAAIIGEISNILKTNFPKSKFAILVYDDNTDIIHLPLDFEEQKMNEIGEKNDIKILYTKKMSIGEEILNGKYRASDDVHPSGEAWRKLVPDIIKELNL